MEFGAMDVDMDIDLGPIDVVEALQPVSNAHGRQFCQLSLTHYSVC